MKEKKVEFEIVKDFPLGTNGTRCDFHPDSDYLLINDGHRVMWCLECLYKLLKEHNNGQWNVETKKESNV